MHIFHAKVCSKPNSNQRKAAQFTFVRKMRTRIMLMKLMPEWIKSIMKFKKIKTGVNPI